jgi:hypothetical protein
MNTEKPSREHDNNSNHWAIGIAIAGGVLAAVLRIVPHPPNFSAVGGLGLFGGARLRGWQAFVFPLGIMVLSDLCLWIVTGFDYNYSLGHISRLFVYAGFMGYVVIGRLLQRSDSLVSVWLGALAGGVLFFVVTNFCEWLFQPLQSYYHLPEVFRYSRDLNGLVTCFAMALGFYQQETGVEYPFMVVTNFPCALLVWTMLGDVFFSSVYVLVYGQLTKREVNAAPAPMTATNA